jgi:putative ABC transport system permease protein
MRDLRYALRVLLKAPVFTIAAVLTLALCIGANTAIYTVVDRVLMRPLPYPEPERLAMVITRFSRGDIGYGQSGGTWEVLQRGVASVELATTSGGFGSTGVNMVVGTHAEYVKQQRVSALFFRVLGVPPAIGREFTAEEDRPNGPTAAILSHHLWTRLFNGDPGALGRSITLRGEPYTVVGVMPDGFTTGGPVDIWTPVRPCRTCEGGGQNYEIIARVKPGVAWAQADAEIAGVAQAAIDDLYRRSDHPVAREEIIPLQSGETSQVRQPILILWGAVAVVLLIGCVNIAGLLMARGVARAPEIATRIALGGGRWVIVRQLLTESVVLAAFGGVAGILLGYVGSRASAALLEDAFGVTQAAIGLDARVLAMTSLIALGTSVVFGLVPALQASGVNLRATLVEAGSASIAGAARSWPRRVLVVAEVALGVVLLVGAGLLIRSFDRLMTLRAGFDPSQLMTATLSLQDARYQTPEKVSQFFDATLSRMRQINGVENAAASLTLPYERALNLGARWVGAQPGADVIPIMNQTYVTPGYFETLRIPVVRGRVFTDADVATAAPVIVVNQAFVARSSPNQDPIGRLIAGGGVSRTIVGVVGDIQQKAGWGNFGPVAPVPASYIPAAQTNAAYLKMVHTWFSPSWFVRLRGQREREGFSRASMAAEMQRAAEAVDPLLPFAKFRTLDDVRSEAVASERAQTLLLSALAVLALLLAAVGLYGLVANTVAERRRELGIRLALGATFSQAIVAAALPGLALAAAGVVAGTIAARLGATAVRHLVFGVSVADPLTFVMAAGTVFLVAAIAAIVPALRIVRLNPIRALRSS